MINSILLYLLICTSCLIGPSVSFGQDLARVTSHEQTSEPRLKLTTELEEKRLCCKNQIQLVVRLKYQNISTQNVILARTVIVYKDFVGRNPKDMKAGKYESSGIKMWSMNLTLPGSTSPNSSYFVILAPGETYESRSMLVGPFPINTDTSTVESRTGLKRGRYFLQVEPVAYPYGTLDKEINELRKRWSAYGFLWTSKLTSLPMPFMVNDQDVESLGM